MFSGLIQEVRFIFPSKMMLLILSQLRNSVAGTSDTALPTTSFVISALPKAVSVFQSFKPAGARIVSTPESNVYVSAPAFGIFASCMSDSAFVLLSSF